MTPPNRGTSLARLARYPETATLRVPEGNDKQNLRRNQRIGLISENTSLLCDLLLRERLCLAEFPTVSDKRLCRGDRRQIQTCTSLCLLQSSLRMEPISSHGPLWPKRPPSDRSGTQWCPEWV